MRAIHCEQRSPEWYKLRAGVVTASNAHRLLTLPKIRTYMLELLGERLIGATTETPVSAAMQWGIDYEDEALEWYSKALNVDVQKVGFVFHDNMKYAGCSPDGLCSTDGLVEVKCPSTHNHLLHISSSVPPNYVAQMQFQMWVTDREWCDFVSYDPRMPDFARGICIRVERDEKMMFRFESGVGSINDSIMEFSRKYFGSSL